MDQNKEELTDNLFKEVSPEMASMEEKKVTTEPVLNFDFSTYMAPNRMQPTTSEPVLPQEPVAQMSQTNDFTVPSYETPTMETVNQPVVPVQPSSEIIVPVQSSDILFDNNQVVNQTENYNNPIPNMVDSIEPKETNEQVEKTETQNQTKKAQSDKSGMIFIGVLFGFLILFVLFLQPISDFISKITG